MSRHVKFVPLCQSLWTPLYAVSPLKIYSMAFPNSRLPAGLPGCRSNQNVETYVALVLFRVAGHFPIFTGVGPHTYYLAGVTLRFHPAEFGASWRHICCYSPPALLCPGRGGTEGGGYIRSVGAGASSDRRRQRGVARRRDSTTGVPSTSPPTAGAMARASAALCLLLTLSGVTSVS